MKENILIFGGGTLQSSIINRAKLLGFTTIVIDPDPLAPASEIADFFYVVGGNDFETTLEIAKKHKVKGIVTAATDKPILMMCRIAEEMQLPFPSYESCETILDKSKFKIFLKKIGLQHAKGQCFTGEIEVEKLDFQFPLITKPVTNSGSRGVIKSNNISELKEAVKETLSHSKDHKFIIEEFIEGDEISVEALVQSGKVNVIQITDKIITPPPYNVELAHIQPSKYIGLKDDIKALLQKIVEESGLDNCALHPELKINDEKITIIEIGPRLGGDFITSDLVPLSTGINMEDEVIKIATGQKITLDAKDNAAMVSFFNFPENFKIKNLISEEELKNAYPKITSLHCKISIDDKTKKIRNSLDRYGNYILKDNSVEELLNTKLDIDNYIKLIMIDYV